MRRALRRACWALAAAGSLGLAAPAAAQTTPAPGQPPAWATSRRATEIEVELAWLADPVTCPCPLTAHVTGPTLEVRGSVPSMFARAQALKLARERSQLAVIDSL